MDGTLPDVTASPDDDEERVYWGKVLEPGILQAVSKRRNLVVRRNASETYERRRSCSVGSTIDALIIDPNRGRGVVEAKSVDWLRWKDAWSDMEAPAHIELQHQTQLLTTGYSWGIISCLIGGNELRQYDRTPDDAIHAEITERAGAFMQSLRDGAEPDPLGTPIEDPFIAARWPRRAEAERLTLMEDREAHELVREYRFWTDREAQSKKARAALKTRLMALVKDHDALRVWGYAVDITRSDVPESFIKLPMEIVGALTEEPTDENGELSDAFWAAVDAAIEWSHVTRKAGTRTLIKVSEIAGDTDQEAPWGDDFATENVEDIFA